MADLDISVVVPVYNPGADIDELLASLDAQTLASDRWEAILVDDGSTDGTGERLDRWATSRPWARVEHIPNSGWPGRPRNVGTDAARGEYVVYADNDDVLDPEALERLVDRARADAADVVVFKVVGHGKHVPRELFRRNRTDVTLDWPPLLRLLSPHKLFRRAFLVEQGIRFPEGRQRLEDHVVVMQAFFTAERISVLADHPIYHWMRRDAGNASWGRMDTAAYFGHDLPAVLDVIDAHTEPGELRDRLYVHWYRSKALWRLQGGAFARRDEAFNRELFAAVRTLMDQRFPPRLDAQLPFSLRLLAQLVRADRFEGAVALATYESTLRVGIRLAERSADEDGIESLRLGCRWTGPGLRLRRDGERLRWVAPEDLVPHLDGIDLDVTDEATAHTDVLIRSRESHVEHVLPAKRRTVLDANDDGEIRPVVRSAVTLDRRTAASGGPLPEGTWEIGVLVRQAGFSAHSFRARVVGPDGTLGERREPVLAQVGPRPRRSWRRSLAARLRQRRRSVSR